MTKAEEKALEVFPDIEINWTMTDRTKERMIYADGYKQAEKDIIEKACDYWSKRISINKEVETNEDGQPYAESYLNWLEERDKAVKEILDDFRKEMEE